jgi:hypothetical protein
MDIRLGDFTEPHRQVLGIILSMMTHKKRRSVDIHRPPLVLLRKALQLLDRVVHRQHETPPGQRAHMA